MIGRIGNLLLAHYSVGQWAMVFFLYSFVGWIWEVLLCRVTRHRWINRGFLSGPVLPIYGFGALGMLFVCLPVKESVGKVAIVGALAASVLEYAAGWLLVRFVHVRYWDYSSQRLNLNGHICLLSAMTWALFSVVVVCVLHPLFQACVRMIPSALAGTLALTLGLFCVTDAAVVGTLRSLWAKRKI